MRPAVRAAGAWLAALLGFSTLTAAAADSEVSWKGRLEVAAGGGHRGPWRMNDSEFLYVDDPTVAISDGGMIGVAWADQSRKDIFFQVYGPDGKQRLAEPVNVSRSPGIFSWLPKIALAAADPRRVYILWQEIVFSGGSHGGEIFFARSTDGGRSFSRPSNLSNSIAGDGKGRLSRDFWHNGSLDIAVGPQGHLYAAWTEYEGALWFSRSSDGGDSFSAPMRVAGSQARPARAPSLAVGAEGSVYLAWTVGEDPAADIRFATSTDHGQSFSAPKVVAASEGHAEAPKLGVDREGTVHLLFAESPGGPLERYHIRYTRLKAGEEAFEKPRELAGPTGEAKSLNFPGLGLDGKDNLYVIWELFPEPKDYPNGLGFTYSTDGGRTFAPPTAIPGSADPALGASGGRQGLLMQKIAVHASGTIAVVHSTFKTGERSHIWLFRGQLRGG